MYVIEGEGGGRELVSAACLPDSIRFQPISEAVAGPPGGGYSTHGHRLQEQCPPFPEGPGPLTWEASH